VAIPIRPAATREDEQLSLNIYNAVWPLDAVTMEDVDSYKAASLAHADHVAWLGGEAAGSGFVAIQPQRPGVGHAALTVLPHHRRRGIGTALYRELSRWCTAAGLETIEAPVQEDDEPSIAYAARRGFTEIEQNSRMVLELAALEPSAVDPPPGIDIVTWADRPELAAGMYEVAVEA
jgi:GNAT superfamily N-acetyltransferase